MDELIDIDGPCEIENFEQTIRNGKFEKIRGKIMDGSIRDRFYYLAQLNRHFPGLSREILFKKIELLTDAYKDLFDPTLPFSTHNVHVCRFFFESATRIGEFRDKLLKYCAELENPSVEDRQHLIDILPWGELKEKTLKSLQTIEVSHPRRGNDVLYHNDTQSAHAVVIVTEDGNELCDRSSEFDVFVTKLPDDIRKMKVIDDIRINNSLQCNVRSTLVHVIDTIINHEDKIELMNRLKEELEEMTDTCTTGMNVRLVNVLTGYSSKIRVALPFETELKAAVFARFNKRLSEASSTLRDMYSASITDREKKVEYIMFKESTRADLSSELRKEYETMPGFDSRLFNSAFADTFTQV